MVTAVEKLYTKTFLKVAENLSSKSIWVFPILYLEIYLTRLIRLELFSKTKNIGIRIHNLLMISQDS